MVKNDDEPQWHMSDPINEDDNDVANDVLVDEDDADHDVVDDVQIFLPQLLAQINSCLDTHVLFACFHFLYRVLQLKI